MTGSLWSEAPNARLDQFKGRLVFDRADLDPIPLDVKNLLLRDTVLKNTVTAVCVCVAACVDASIGCECPISLSPSIIFSCACAMSQLMTFAYCCRGLSHGVVLVPFVSGVCHWFSGVHWRRHQGAAKCVGGFH
jgi:hypothetical protein